MLGGGLPDSLDGATFEPSGWATEREAGQVEADDNLTAADVAGPQLASQPLPVRSRQALPRQCVLPATRGPSRLQPSHRSHARDGPKSKSAACPTTKCPRAKVIVARIPRPRQHRVELPRQPSRILNTRRVGATDRPPFRVARVRIEFLYPTRTEGKIGLAERRQPRDRQADRPAERCGTCSRRGRLPARSRSFGRQCLLGWIATAWGVTTEASREPWRCLRLAGYVSPFA